MKTLSKIFLLVTVLAAATVGQAQLLTFDSLGNSMGTAIPNGYGGFQWSNFSFLTSSTVPGASGYQNGTVSPGNVAFNRFGAPAAFWSASSFDLTSLYLTGAWNDGLQVQIQGFTGGLSGTLLFDNTFSVDISGPSFLLLNYTGIDAVRFTSFDGIDNPDDIGEGTQFALDNMLVGNLGSAVPEPSTYGLIAAITLSGLVAWKRRRT